jgi:saccharopine dehydrogenase-like NADP-dependent oxidoreductase
LFAQHIFRRLTMKLLALGGSGNMGRTAVKTILEMGNVDELIVADSDAVRTNSFVGETKDRRVRARVIDVTDTEALEALMGEADVVMNTIGPYYRFGVPIVQAAIKTGRHYTDINDDYRPTEEVLKMDDQARTADITALIGIGASPGLTNILARHAANQLDTVDYIQTAWGSTGGVLEPRSRIRAQPQGERIDAATVHFLNCASWKIPLFRDGKFIEVLPLEDGEEVTFPNGKGFFYYIGHAEPVTLPRFIKGRSGACNLFGSWFGPEGYDVLRSLGARVRAKELNPEEAAKLFVEELYRRLMMRPDVPQDTGPVVGGLHASAAGKKAGKKMRYGFGLKTSPPDDMAGVTGIPLAIATDMLIRGEITRRGILAPEACIDPLPFFERFRQYCPGPPRDVGEALYEVVEEL